MAVFALDADHLAILSQVFFHSFKRESVKASAKTFERVTRTFSRLDMFSQLRNRKNLDFFASSASVTYFDLIVNFFEDVRFYISICKWIHAPTMSADGHVAVSGLFVAS